MKTIRLQLPSPRRWWELSTPAAAAIAFSCLLAIAFVVGALRRDTPPAPLPMPALEKQAAIIIIATAQPAPIPTVAPPTPDGRVLEELAALRAQVAQLQAAQQATPQVIYVQPEAPAYQVTNEQLEQAAPTPEQPTAAPVPQQQAILDRGAWASQAATAKAGR